MRRVTERDDRAGSARTEYPRTGRGSTPATPVAVGLASVFLAVAAYALATLSGTVAELAVGLETEIGLAVVVERIASGGLEGVTALAVPVLAGAFVGLRDGTVRSVALVAGSIAFAGASLGSLLYGVETLLAPAREGPELLELLADVCTVAAVGGTAGAVATLGRPLLRGRRGPDPRSVRPSPYVLGVGVTVSVVVAGGLEFGVTDVVSATVNSSSVAIEEVVADWTAPGTPYVLVGTVVGCVAAIALPRRDRWKAPLAAAGSYLVVVCSVVGATWQSAPEKAELYFEPVRKLQFAAVEGTVLATVGMTLAVAIGRGVSVRELGLDGGRSRAGLGDWLRPIGVSCGMFGAFWVVPTLWSVLLAGRVSPRPIFDALGDVPLDVWVQVAPVVAVVVGTVLALDGDGSPGLVAGKCILATVAGYLAVALLAFGLGVGTGETPSAESLHLLLAPGRLAGSVALGGGVGAVLASVLRTDPGTRRVGT